jgi:hypothetical protein
MRASRKGPQERSKFLDRIPRERPIGAQLNLAGAIRAVLRLNPHVDRPSP